MYTTSPIPPIDTLNCHTGAYVALAIFVVVILLHISDQITIGLKPMSCLAVIVASIMVYSYNSGSITVFENQKVHGNFVRFISTSENKMVPIGKTMLLMNVKEQFVEYEVDGNHVTIPASSELEYPKHAILYKN